MSPVTSASRTNGVKRAFRATGRPVSFLDVIYTIGHSTRPWPEFRALLTAHGITHVVDVRRYPASRRHPHFARDALAVALAEADIGYDHAGELGGRRVARPDSVNTAWRSGAFRGYADHMDTPVFQTALARLLDVGRTRRTVVLCAEAVPWRCHRQLIADALVASGESVAHILSETRLDAHRLSPHARVIGEGRVRYPAGPV